MKRKKKKESIQTLPYEKFLAFGPESLTNEELLAIILRTGAKGKSVLTLACQVLALGNREAGILELNHLTLKQLQSIDGIGEVKAIQLKAVAELSKRMAMARFRKDVCLSSPGIVAEAYMERMRHFEKEQCLAVFLDAADCRIADKVMSVGSLTMSLVSSREILREALLLNASGIILLHNHPSGNPRPSREDYVITAKLREAARLMEVSLLDHIIIGDGTYFSFQEEGDL